MHILRHNVLFQSGKMIDCQWLKNGKWFNILSLNLTLLGQNAIRNKYIPVFMLLQAKEKSKSTFLPEVQLCSTKHCPRCHKCPKKLHCIDYT